jgi:FkbM family methyltransferase
MTNLLRRIAASAGRRVVDCAASSAWLQQRAWELITARRGPPESAAAPEFLAFCAAHCLRSKAQLCQDLWALWETASKRNGFFVEFGATNGVDLSNSFLLEKSYGWRGILAEPFEVWHADLHRNRSARIDHRCVWKRSGESLEFVETVDRPEYAGLRIGAFDDCHAAARAQTARSRQVATVSLLDLLAEHEAPPHIDYLSVDTEGTELEILECFDFSRYRVDLISVEHNFHAGKRASLGALLERNGFVRQLEAFSLWDDWYASRRLLNERRAGQFASPRMR